MLKQLRKPVLLRPSLIAAAGVALTLMLPVADASAANFFEMLFGIRRAVPSAPPPSLPAARPSASESSSGNIVDERREYGGGPSTSFCVRLCDGQPFPVQNNDSSPAQVCSAMCPAAQTKVFSGSSIDHAVASDGKRYASLPTAFSYRKKLSADCTCNGKSPVGLVQHMDVRDDPTLRRGDIVATNEGLKSYNGENRRGVAGFSPVQDRKLAGIQVRPAPSSMSAAALAANARAEAPRKGDDSHARDSRRRDQR